MNIFELSFFLSLVIGLVSGGIAAKPYGVLAILLGCLIGLVIGLICYVAILGVSILLAKTIRSENPPKKLIFFVPWWLVNFTSAVIVTVSPVLTILLVRVLKTLVMK